jgi:hypothetical protein
MTQQQGGTNPSPKKTAARRSHPLLPARSKYERKALGGSSRLNQGGGEAELGKLQTAKPGMLLLP